MGGSVYAIQVDGADSTVLANSLFVEHGIIVRPFALSEDVQTLRISPKFNTEDELERLAPRTSHLAPRTSHVAHRTSHV